MSDSTKEIKESIITIVDKNKVGRPSIITIERVSILIASFQRGFNVETACQQAQLSRESYYKHYREDSNFADRMNKARSHIVQLAGERYVKILKEGSDRDAVPLIKLAFERKMRDEWGPDVGVIVNNNVAYKPPSWFEAEVVDGKS